MIPAALLSFLTSKVGKYVLMTLAVLFVLAGIYGYAVHRLHEAYREGHEAAVVEYQKATATESERRHAVLQAVQKQADQDLAKLASSQLTNEKLQREIKRLAAARAATPCWDVDSVRALDQIGRPAGN